MLQSVLHKANVLILILLIRTRSSMLYLWCSPSGCLERDGHCMSWMEQDCTSGPVASNRTTIPTESSGQESYSKSNLTYWSWTHANCELHPHHCSILTIVYLTAGMFYRNPPLRRIISWVHQWNFIQVRDLITCPDKQSGVHVVEQVRVKWAILGSCYCFWILWKFVWPHWANTIARYK